MCAASWANSSGLPRRCGNGMLAARTPHGFGQGGHQRRGKQARWQWCRRECRAAPGHVPSAASMPATPAWRRCSLLTDLAVKGGDRGGEHHRPAFPVFHRLQLGTAAATGAPRCRADQLTLTTRTKSSSGLASRRGR